MKKINWNGYMRKAPVMVKDKNGKEVVYKGRAVTQPSLTNPDDAMSIQEILRRSQNNTISRSINATKTFDSPVEQNHDSVDIEEMATWSLPELQSYRENYMTVIKEAEEKLTAAKKEKLELKKKEEFKIAVEEEILRRQETQTIETTEE